MSKRRAKKHDEHMDESWLIPYADILTLLLALFIVLFSMSQVDQLKFMQLKSAFESVFSGNPGMLVSESGLIENENAIFDDPPSDFVEEDNRLQEYKARLDAYFEMQGMENVVTTVINEQGLQISIQEVALFDSGKADLRPEVYKVLNHLSVILAELDNNVEISGHTDNVPINTREFPSNWELSVARSLNVMKYLLNNNDDLKPERFSIVGYGEYRPKATNDTVEGRALNRRVELMIKRMYTVTPSTLVSQASQP